MIDRLIEARVTDDQLDESLLTMRDIDTVKRQFAHTLTGLYHHRIDYAPEGRAAGDTTRVQTSEAEQAQAGDTGPAPDLEPRREPAADRGGPLLPAEGSPAEGSPAEGSVVPVHQLWQPRGEPPRRSAG